MLKPHVKKIQTVLSFVNIKFEELNKVRDLGLDCKEMSTLLFVADVIHMNLYGRPVTFDTYRVKNGFIEAIHVSKIIDTELQYDWDKLSESDKEILTKVLKEFVEDTGWLVVANDIALQAYLNAMAKGEDVVIPFQDMLADNDAKEDRIDHILSINHGDRYRSW